MLLSCEPNSQTVKVGARDSVLSQAQVQEVFLQLQEKHPTLFFHNHWLSSPGDRDLVSSLRPLEKTDFFTQDLDNALLSGELDVAIHSAKDLPDPLPEGIALIAITAPLPTHDVLVFPEEKPLALLPKRPVVGTSSERREHAVRKLHPDAICCDIRGSVLNRLEQLDRGDFDAIVTAECALIRLKLTHRLRERLPGAATPLQGALAVTARQDNTPIAALFAPIDTRQQT